MANCVFAGTADIAPLCHRPILHSPSRTLQWQRNNAGTHEPFSHVNQTQYWKYQLRLVENANVNIQERQGSTVTAQCKSTLHLQISPLLIFKCRLINYECCNYCMLSSQAVLMNSRLNFREQAKRPAADLEKTSRSIPSSQKITKYVECVYMRACVLRQNKTRQKNKTYTSLKE